MTGPAIPTRAPSRWMTVTTPSGRLLAGLLVIVPTALLPVTTRGLTLALGVAAVVLVGTRPPLRWLLATLGLAFVPIVGVVFPLFISEPETAWRLLVRATAVTSVTLGVASTIQTQQLGGALRGIGVPAILATVVSTMLRQVARLAPEGRQLLLARRLRGARGGWVGPDVLAHLLVRTHRRAERIALATELRGGGAGIPRPTPLTRHDAWLVVPAAGLACGIHLIARAWG